MEAADSRAVREGLRRCADGKHLVSNTIWRRFPHLQRAMAPGKNALIGDAAHTAHFHRPGRGSPWWTPSLDKALAAHGDDAGRRRLPEAAAADRRQIVTERQRGLVTNFAEYMELAPLEFAMSYVMRSRPYRYRAPAQLSPRFVELYVRSPYGDRSKTYRGLG